MAEVDWNSRRFCSGLEFMQMPGWQRHLIAMQPNIWRPHPNIHVDAMVNMAHPQNAGLAALVLLSEASHG